MTGQLHELQAPSARCSMCHVVPAEDLLCENTSWNNHSTAPACRTKVITKRKLKINPFSSLCLYFIVPHCSSRSVFHCGQPSPMGAAVTASVVKLFGEKYPKPGKQGAVKVVALQSTPRAFLSISSGSSCPLPCCNMALQTGRADTVLKSFIPKSEWEVKITASFLFHAIKPYQVFQPH